MLRYGLFLPTPDDNPGLVLPAYDYVLPTLFETTPFWSFLLLLVPPTLRRTACQALIEPCSQQSPPRIPNGLTCVSLTDMCVPHRLHRISSLLQSSAPSSSQHPSPSCPHADHAGSWCIIHIFTFHNTKALLVPLALASPGTWICGETSPALLRSTEPSGKAGLLLHAGFILSLCCWAIKGAVWELSGCLQEQQQSQQLSLQPFLQGIKSTK